MAPPSRLGIVAGLIVAAVVGVEGFRFWWLRSHVHEAARRTAWLRSHAHEAARRTACANNLYQIAMALIRYEAAHGHFPAVRGGTEDPGTAMSWRVAILPFLERTDLFQEYRADEPWDGPTNRGLARSAPAVFRCPSLPADEAGETTGYVMIAGKGALGGLVDADRTADHVANWSGTSLTLLVIELPGGGIHWMDPRDPTIDEILERIRHRDRRIHGGAVLAVFCDGHVLDLPEALSLETIRALADPERSEPIDLSGLDS